MDNTNNNKPADQNEGQQPNNPPYLGQMSNQNPNQGSMNSEAGKTYWEANAEQNNSNSQNNSNQQNNPSQDTPAQFYQYYQQQMGANNNSSQQPQQQMYSQMQAQLQKPKKKSHKKLFASLIVVAIILGIAGTAFAFKDRILNALSMGTKSPEEYYASVEQDALNASIDKMITNYDRLKTDKMAYKVTTDVSFDKDTISSMLSGYLGMSIEDIENTIGLSLDSIGADMTVAVEDSNFYNEMILKLNNIDIITAQIIVDSVKEAVFMRFPELSSAYLSQSIDYSDLMYGMDSIESTIEWSELNSISPKEVGDFIKRYVKIATENIKNVELSKKEELTVGDTTEKCNLLTITFDEETLIDITAAILKEAKEDEFLFDIISMMGVSKKDYVDALDEAADELDNLAKGSMDGELIMKVYVDGNGKIIGRVFELISNRDTVGTFGYAMATKGDKSEFELYYEDENGDRILDVTGNQVENKGAYTGEADIEFNIDEYTNYGLSIEYEDARSEFKDNRLFNYGSYSISSPDLMGMGLSLEFDVKDNVQHSKLSLDMGKTALVTLNISTEYLKDFDIPSISGSDQVFDMYDISAYESTLNLDKYINDLSTKLGTDLSYIFDLLSYY